MDGALALDLNRIVIAKPIMGRIGNYAMTSREVAVVAAKDRLWNLLERPRVQILVVVANIQVRTL